MRSESEIEALVRFARFAGEPDAAGSVLTALADGLAGQVGAAHVAIVEVRTDGEGALVHSPHTPPPLFDVPIEVDALGDELTTTLAEHIHWDRTLVSSRLLVSQSDLFGLAVLFFAAPPEPRQLRLAEGFIDLAALALSNAAHVASLGHSHAELRTTFAALAHAERLNALGQMAAGITHDLKNILNPLSLHVQYLQRAISRGKLEEATESLAEMRRVVARGVETVERIRSYSRREDGEAPAPIDVPRLVAEAIEIVKPRTKGRAAKSITWRLELGDAPRVMGRAVDVVSCVVNLLANAIDALAATGGTIEARTGGSTDGHAFVEIIDDGPGIPEEVRRRVTEPFFTTKGEQGTGLGLAMVDTCMRRHGGKLSLFSSPGAGTTVRLDFPP